MYTKPVYVQMFIKPVYCTGEECTGDRHYTTNERNVKGTDITSEKNVQIL